MLINNVSLSELKGRVSKPIRRSRNAPGGIALCRERSKVWQQPDITGERIEEHKGMQSFSIAVLPLLLSAQAEGPGANWIYWPPFAPNETCQVLGLPYDWEPEGLIFIRNPSESPMLLMRLIQQQVTMFS